MSIESLKLESCLLFCGTFFYICRKPLLSPICFFENLLTHSNVKESHSTRKALPRNSNVSEVPSDSAPPNQAECSQLQDISIRCSSCKKEVFLVGFQLCLLQEQTHKRLPLFEHLFGRRKVISSSFSEKMKLFISLWTFSY